MIKSEPMNITTPVCQFQFAWLVEPDTKFDPAGIWQVECLIDPEKSQEIEEQLTAYLERWKAQLKSANPQKKYKLAPMQWEYTEVDGKPFFKIKSKLKATVTYSDGTVRKNRPPALFKADGVPMSEDEKQAVNKCGPGTTGQVNLRCKGWKNPSFGVGVTIQPEAAIIHNHVEYTKTAQAYGFETEEATIEEEKPKAKAGFETVGADEFQK